ncbi:MAG: hypothetical protein EP347_04750 [Alphaproteobacteria bacterium]|nr:MAG: hypothetical protein EP347_04750 [Alphaproteobacteria bacterium]
MAKTENKEFLKPAEFARKVWLAGVGAYGKAFEDAQERFEKLNLESNELFDNLVKKGEKIETETQKRLEKVQAEATSNIEDRIAKVRESIAFPFPKVVKEDRIEKLELEVAALKRKVAALSSTKAAPKKAAKKKAAKKAA